MNDFRERLGQELDAAFARSAARRTRRRRVAGLVAAGFGVAVAASALSLFVRSSPVGAGVEVSERGGLVYVRLLEGEFDPDEIEMAVRNAGLDVDVDAVPVGPSLVGKFVRDQIEGSDLGTLRRLGEDGDTFAGFVLPAGWDGHLSVDVGRPAGDDEDYAVPSNALSEGEPLACTDVIGLLPADAAALLEARSLQGMWRGVSGRAEVRVDERDLDAVPWRTQLVSHALALGPRTVVVYLSETGMAARLDLRLTRPEACDGSR